MPKAAMQPLPAKLGRTVFAQIDEPGSDDPIAQAAGWLARLEPWFGPCRSVAVLSRRLGPAAVTVVSAGHAGDRAAIVHLATPGPDGRGASVRIEGSGATLQIADGTVQLTDRSGLLEASGIALPDAPAARTSRLHEALRRALQSREVETVDG